VGSLRRIAEALDVSILYFLDEGPKHHPVVRANERSTLQLRGSDVTYELLMPDISRKFEVFLGRIGPKTRFPARRLREPTEECIFLMSGSLIIELDSGEYHLNQGDSIFFDGPSLIRFSNGSDKEEAVWIAVISPPVF